MSKQRTVEVVVMNRGGWFVAACKELEISGFGETQKEALESFQKALLSTVTARLEAAVYDAEKHERDDDLPARYPLGAPVAV